MKGMGLFHRMTCQGASDWLERELIAERKWKRFSDSVVYCLSFLDESYRVVYHVMDVSPPEAVLFQRNELKFYCFWLANIYSLHLLT